MRKIGQNRVILLLFLKLSDISHKLCILTPLNVVLSGLFAYQNIVYSILPIDIVPERARVRVYAYVHACVYLYRYALDMVII